MPQKADATFGDS